MAHSLVTRTALPALLALIVVASLAILGCGSSTDVQGAGTSPTAMMSGGTLTGNDTSLQTCSACAGGTAPQVYGKTQTVNGVQVVDIGVKNGFYSPNEFTVAAGTPVKVVFSGKAEGCLAKPTFKGIGTKADFTSGEATVDLGELKAGTYEFTCGMGMAGGKIVVQ
jgi:plastocyanin